MIKILAVCILLLSLQGCTIAVQRGMEAEARLHDYAVWIFDNRKEDRRIIRDLVRDHVKDLERKADTLSAAGEFDKAATLRKKAISFIKNNTPSVTDAIKSIKDIFKAIKK